MANSIFLVPNSDGQPEPTTLFEPASGRRKTHTDKWDSCVSKVQSKGTGNAYAICTASLGDRSFLKYGQVMRSKKRRS